MIQQYETIEMISSNALLISVDAERFEKPLRFLVRDEYSDLIAQEEIQSKYNSSAVYPVEPEFLRVGFLYQVMLCGEPVDLLKIKDEATKLVKNIQLLEKCIKKEYVA